MKTWLTMLAVLSLGLWVGCDNPQVKKAEDKMNQAAHDTAEAGKEMAEEAKEKIKEGAHEAADATKKGAHEAAHAVKEGAAEVEEETK